MSSIAQKLCDELVEPALKPSKDSTTKRSSNKFLSRSNSRPDSKSSRSIIIEKKKVINRLVPNDSNASRTKFKSKDTLLKKKFTDIAVNTLITGPLRCDNDCVTMVRKRDNKCSCKCAQKRLNYKASAKQMQTISSRHFSLTDKACAQCIETNSCGTQFLEKLSGVLKPQNSTGTKKSSIDMKINSSLKYPFRVRPEGSTPSKPTILNYMGARRWALSQYPTRGPDF